MANPQESEIPFPSPAFLASVAMSLKAPTEAGKIGPWRIGHWADFRHTAIRIQFGTSADGQRASSFVENWHRAQAPADGL